MRGGSGRRRASGTWASGRGRPAEPPHPYPLRLHNQQDQAAPGRRAERARRGHVTFQSKDMSGARIWIETKRAGKRPP